MAKGQLALLCLLGLAMVISRASSQEECEIPTWPFQPQPAQNIGPNPFVEYRGKVLLVALVKAYCQYCLGQAQNLSSLRTELHSSGYTDVEMIVINGGDALSRQMISHLTDATSLPVYQDTSNDTMFDEVFYGSKDDFIVYDRCGQRVYHIPHPYSYLGHSITELVLKAVHDGRHNCHCSLDYQRSTRRRNSSRRNSNRRRRPRRDVSSQDPDSETQSEVSSTEAEGGGGWGNWFSNLFGYSSASTGRGNADTARPIVSVDTTFNTDNSNSAGLDCPLRDSLCERYSTIQRLSNGGLSGGQSGRGRHRHHGHHPHGRRGHHGHHRHHGRHGHHGNHGHHRHHGHHGHHGQTDHDHDGECSHAPRRVGSRRFGNWFVENGLSNDRRGGPLGQDRDRRRQGGNL